MSASFLRTLTGSHAMAVEARILSTFQTGVDPDGLVVPILGGAATFDATAEIRGSLDMTTDGTGMWPSRADGPLAPYGNEVFVRRGIQYGNGTTEWVSLGYFRIQAPGQDTPPDGPIRLTGKDRMIGIRSARLVAPIQFDSSTTYGAVVTQLITGVYPAATVEWDDATDAEELGRSLLTEEKRYEFVDDLVTSRGKIWYWDHRGVCVIRDPPDATEPVWDVSAGAGGVLVSMSRELTRERVYNAVVASGEGTDTTDPVRAVAIDDNPQSPTYFYGRFGPEPQFYSSQFLVTEAQCAAAAASILRGNLGLPYNVNFNVVPNPALEPYDPVRITYSPQAPAEVHVLKAVTVPLLQSGALTASTREQTSVLIGAL